MEEPQKHAKGKKPDTEGHVMCDCLHTISIFVETERRLVVARGWRLAMLEGAGLTLG